MTKQISIKHKKYSFNGYKKIPLPIFRWCYVIYFLFSVFVVIVSIVESFW